MDLTANVFPSDLFWLANLLFLPLLMRALLGAPWSRFKESEQRHVYMGFMVLLLLLWRIKAGVNPALHFHLLGGTLFTLMFGWELALIGISIVLAGVTYYGNADWSSLALNGLLMGAVPVGVSYALYRLAVRFLPRHFFVYVLVNGYLAGAVAMAVFVAVACALLLCCSSYTAEQLLHDYLPFLPMMVFAEGFFTGMLVAGMALFNPNWISTFDDDLYLKGK